MRVDLVIPVIVSILILGTLGLTLVYGISESVFVPEGEDVTVEVPFPEMDVPSQIKLEFDQVIVPGNLEIEKTQVPPEPEPSSGFRLVGQSPFADTQPYFGITFDGSFTGMVEICVNYDDSFLNPVQESMISLHHFDEIAGVWVDITNTPPYPNTEINLVCGSVANLKQPPVQSEELPADEIIIEPFELPYSPPRITPKPIIIGTSSVRIAAESSTPGCEERYHCYLPFSISVVNGTSVTWTNDDSEPHTVTNGLNPADLNAGMMFDSGLLLNQDLFSFTFETDGEYPYYCVLHPWMTGLVVVDSEIPQVPDWIRNNAKWWAEGNIDDLTFVQGIEWLINEGVMTTDEISSYESSVGSGDIPSWIKNNAGWWAEGLLSDRDFISGIEYLVERGIIIVDISVEIPPDPLENCSGSAACFVGFVTSVIDGDTIHVDGNSIRFSLASTPELGEVGGFDAKQFVGELCPVGSEALVDEDDGQTKGSYGRMVAVVYCNGVNLNEAVLESGHAWVSTSFCSTSEFSSEDWAVKFGC